MIIIRVELHSHVTRKVTEIARMRICNIGGTASAATTALKRFAAARRSSSRVSFDSARQRSATIRSCPSTSGTWSPVRWSAWATPARAW
jgi:hypothetical protein